jgi:hypothetical protein
MVQKFGYFWGISGVLLILLFAIYRLAPMALALFDTPLEFLHWVSLIFSIIYMAYAEGYKGFHLSFAPRVVTRAQYLTQNPKFIHIVLAPLFCMGYIHSTRRRQLISFGLAIMIIGFVFLVRLLPQPWRGILDAGVVVGLTMGCASILYFIYFATHNLGEITVSADIPGYDNKLESN